MQKGVNCVVKDVYKDGCKTTKEKYTQAWAGLINSKEKSKIIALFPGCRQVSVPVKDVTGDS